jgi:hypothetical protein
MQDDRYTNALRTSPFIFSLQKMQDSIKVKHSKVELQQIIQQQIHRQFQINWGILTRKDYHIIIV